MDRRRLVKWLIVLAIAVPLVVEGVTFLGLVSNQLGGGDGGDSTPATGADAVGVGDELIEETTQRETLTAASIRGGDRWTLTLTVTVNNTAETPYELRLGDVRAGNRVIEGATSTGQIEGGGRSVVTAQWSLPSGTLPDTVSVTAIQYDGEGGVSRTVQRQVDLASIPVQG